MNRSLTNPTICIKSFQGLGSKVNQQSTSCLNKLQIILPRKWLIIIDLQISTLEALVKLRYGHPLRNQSP